jgi:hypothetical protein
MKSIDDIMNRYKENSESETIQRMPEEWKAELRQLGYTLETTITNIELPAGQAFVISEFRTAGEEHEDHSIWIIHNNKAYGVNGAPSWYEHKDHEFNPVFDQFLKSITFIDLIE